jgi:hypothetical protein
VRVAFLIRKGVMLAVNRHPLLGALAGGQPQRHLEHPLDRRVDDERFVGGAAVQVDGGAEHRHLNQNRGNHEGEEKMRKHDTALQERL